MHGPLFGIPALRVVGGLLLCCLAAELIHEVGVDRVRKILFGVAARDGKD